MADMTIPDALENDFRDHYRSAPVATPHLDASRVRRKHETEDFPCPRLVITAGEPKRQPGMSATARVPLTLELVTSLDQQSTDLHRTVAAVIDAWLREIRSMRGGRGELSAFTRLYLHDLILLQPSARIEERWQVTQFRCEAVVTLYA
jgi:hypothetical protein